MLNLWGRSSRSCEGWSRREWLRLGGLGTLGLSLSDVLAARGAVHRDAPQDAAFGRAKRCIVLFMFGAPAHQDTWDMKPDAPADVRGEFQPISTVVPGIQISEHMPLLATLTDRLAIVRSVTHPDNTHTVAMHYMLTGVRHIRPATNPQNAADDFPCFGAVTNYWSRYAVKPVRAASTSAAESQVARLPAAVSLNAPANQVSANNHIFPGFFAGLLGQGHDPLFVPKHANDPQFEPFTTSIGTERLVNRQRLLAELDVQAHAWEQSAASGLLTAAYEQAFGMLTSSAARQAFDLTREPPEMRARYGDTPFGQGCLLARRLIESGVTLVTVNWERDDAYWDTHKNNFIDHREKLLPNMDRGFSALVLDLEQRGLLDDTLIVWLAEFGRTPKINSAAGRDHWAPCNSVVLAGAGIPGGHVHGASDRIAAYPLRDPVGPEDLAATVYHRLGIPPDFTVHDSLARPLLVRQGQPLYC